MEANLKTDPGSFGVVIAWLSASKYPVADFSFLDKFSLDNINREP
jgi:hypothetical protein